METLVIAVAVSVFAIPMTLPVVMSVGLAVGVRSSDSSHDVGHVSDLLRGQLPHGSEVQMSRCRCLGYNIKKEGDGAIKWKGLCTNRES